MKKFILSASLIFGTSFLYADYYSKMYYTPYNKGFAFSNHYSITNDNQSYIISYSESDWGGTNAVPSTLWPYVKNFRIFVPNFTKNLTIASQPYTDNFPMDSVYALGSRPVQGVSKSTTGFYIIISTSYSSTDFTSLDKWLYVATDTSPSPSGRSLQANLRGVLPSTSSDIVVNSDGSSAASTGTTTVSNTSRPPWVTFSVNEYLSKQDVDTYVQANLSSRLNDPNDPSCGSQPANLKPLCVYITSKQQIADAATDDASSVPADTNGGSGQTSGTPASGSPATTSVQPTYSYGSMPDQTMTAGTPKTFTISGFTDPSGGALTYAVTTTPAVTGLNINGNSINMPATVPVGTYTITVTATNGSNKTAIGSFYLTVSNPQIQSMTVAPGQSKQLLLPAGATQVNYKINIGNVSFDSSTGSGTTPFDTNGSSAGTITIVNNDKNNTIQLAARNFQIRDSAKGYILSVGGISVSTLSGTVSVDSTAANHATATVTATDAGNPSNFVKTNVTVQYTASGTLSLKKGWNLVTIPANTTVPASTFNDAASASSTSGRKLVWAFNPPSASRNVKSLRDGLPSVLPATTQMTITGSSSQTVAAATPTSTSSSGSSASVAAVSNAKPAQTVTQNAAGTTKTQYDTTGALPSTSTPAPVPLNPAGGSTTATTSDPSSTSTSTPTSQNGTGETSANPPYLSTAAGQYTGNITAGQGVWIKVEADTSLPISGAQNDAVFSFLTAVSVLGTGWNVVGNSGAEAPKLTSADDNTSSTSSSKDAPPPPPGNPTATTVKVKHAWGLIGDANGWKNYMSTAPSDAPTYAPAANIPTGVALWIEK